MFNKFYPLVDSKSVNKLKHGIFKLSDQDFINSAQGQRMLVLVMKLCTNII